MQRLLDLGQIFVRLLPGERKLKKCLGLTQRERIYTIDSWYYRDWGMTHSKSMFSIGIKFTASNVICANWNRKSCLHWNFCLQLLLSHFLEILPQMKCITSAIARRKLIQRSFDRSFFYL